MSCGTLCGLLPKGYSRNSRIPFSSVLPPTDTLEPSRQTVGPLGTLVHPGAGSSARLDVAADTRLTSKTVLISDSLFMARVLFIYRCMWSDWKQPHNPGEGAAPFSDLG